MHCGICEIDLLADASMIYTAGGSMESGDWLEDAFAYTKPTDKQFCKSLFHIDISNDGCADRSL